jgi:hypothetical protein
MLHHNPPLSVLSDGRHSTIVYQMREALANLEGKPDISFRLAERRVTSDKSIEKVLAPAAGGC